MQVTEKSIRLLLLSLASLLLWIAGCGTRISEKALIGSWRPSVAPAGRQLSFTFNEDHTLVIYHLIKGRELQERGFWQTDGNVLSMRTTLDPNGRAVLPPIIVRVRISELNHTTLIWHEGAFSNRVRLDRVNRRPESH